MTESQLKDTIKQGDANLYVLYGAETYLVEQYARLIARQTVEEGFDAFNLHRFDGQEVSAAQLEDAVEALPLMSDRKCVLVRDYDVGPDHERVMKLTAQVPDSCVLVFWQMTLQPDKKKAWKDFLDAANKVGTVVEFARKTGGDVVKLLVSGAKRRGCVLAPEDARYLVEQAGNDLQLLLNEIDKLTALAGEGGTVTRDLIDKAATKNLEAKVFDLSKAILSRHGTRAYSLLHQLAQQREEPLVVLGVLSGAYADLYRVKVAVAAGQSTTAPADLFPKTYKGKEWRLRNAGRDAAPMSVAVLRDCLELLARADTGMKRGGDGWLLLEQTVAGLLRRAREG
jgi:DNA polymerase-3 subunit delta